MIHPLRLALMAGLVFGLGACGPLISFSDNEPETVYTITYPNARAIPDTGPLVFISEPTFAKGLGGRGISVRLNDYERTSIKNVRWSTAASSLIRDFLVSGLRDRSHIRAIGEDGLDVKTTCRLNTYIWAMDFIPADRPADDQIAISLELSLIDLAEGTLISSALFKDTRTADASPRGITSAMNASLMGQMPEISTWLDRHVSACMPD